MYSRAISKSGFGRRHLGRSRGFSLLEVLIGIVVLAVVIVTLYTAFAQGTFMTHVAREDLRASQILLEKSEVIRLCGWNQVCTNLPATFTAPYDPRMPNYGLVYNGSISIMDAPMAAGYGNNLKEARIRLTWKTGKVPHERELRTYIARYGLQTYVD